MIKDLEIVKSLLEELDLGEVLRIDERHQGSAWSEYKPIYKDQTYVNQMVTIVASDFGARRAYTTHFSGTLYLEKE